MPKTPFFKFNADAWLTGKIQTLSAQEKGIFIDLVARIWKENGSIKNDELLHRLIRVQKGTLRVALQTLLKIGLIVENDGVLSVKFISEQIQKQNDYASKQAEFGRIGGRSKKGTLSKNKGYPKATLSDNKGYPFEEKKEKTERNFPLDNPPIKKEQKEKAKECITLSDVPSSSVTPEPGETPGNPGRRTGYSKIYFSYDGDAKIHGITPELLAYWSETYPAIDVEAELKAASAWLDANRKNRKTDVKRFLVNWLKRTQDRAPRVANQPEPHNQNGKKWDI